MDLKLAGKAGYEEILQVNQVVYNIFIDDSENTGWQ